VSKLTETQKQEANRVAKEIEGGDAKGNRHLAEERGQIHLRDNDYENEEANFSAVHRSDQPRHHSGFGKKEQAVKKNKKNNNSQAQNASAKQTTESAPPARKVLNSKFKCFNKSS